MKCSPSRHLVHRSLLAVVVVAVLLVLYVVSPEQAAWLPRCPFKVLTSLNCPGCGLQRAVHASLHGQWAAAWHYNPFLFFALPYVALLAVVEWLMPEPRRQRWRLVLEGRTAVVVYISLYLLWGVVRNVAHC